MSTTGDDIEAGHARTPEELAQLASYLADAGEDADTIAYAVEKPWKYQDAWHALHVGIPPDEYEPDE